MGLEAYGSGPGYRVSQDRRILEGQLAEGLEEGGEEP